jgi:hypothetical protein
VAVFLSRKLAFLGVVASLSAAGARAQSWGAGVTIGAVHDVDHHFHWEDFKPKDVNGWVDFEVQDKVILRATFGEMRAKGANAGQTVTLASGAQVTLPDLLEEIRYGTLGVSYEIWEGTFTSGIFAGIGGYKVVPRDAPPEIANFRDNRETSFGWHVGADGGVELIKHLSLVARLTLHRILSTSGRTLLTANTGLTYRF